MLSILVCIYSSSFEKYFYTSFNIFCLTETTFCWIVDLKAPTRESISNIFL